MKVLPLAMQQGNVQECGVAASDADRAAADAAHTNVVWGTVLRGWRGYERGMGKLVHWISMGNRVMGEWTSRRPWLMLLLSLALTVCACVGWVRFRLEDSSEILWVPQSGKAQDDTAYVRAHFPRAKAGASFYASLRADRQAQFGSNNALQIPVTWEMFQLHREVMAISVLDDDTGLNVTFQNLCYRTRSKTCSRGSYLNFWNFDFDLFLSSINGSATDPAAGNEDLFRAQVSKLTYPDGGAVSLLSVFGGTTFSFSPQFQLASAQVIASDYTMDNSVSKATGKKWHDKFKDLMLARLPTMQYMSAVFITGSSVQEELSAAINNDMILVIISIIVYFVIAVLLLSKYDAVATRTSLALMGILVTALGIIAGWGWGMMFGMPFTPLQQLSPFILVGMGIDVIFIIVKAYDIIMYRQPDLTLQQAFGQIMATAGFSVQVTLFASAVAFALGAVNVLPSVKWFSAFATLNTLMIMVLMTTMFIAMFVLTERRIAANRRDCCCCAPCAKAPPLPLPLGHVASSSSPAAASGRSSGGVGPGSEVPVMYVMSKSASGGKGGEPGAAGADHTDLAPPPTMVPASASASENFVKYIFRVYYAPALTKWYVKALVLAVFLGYAIACFFGIYRLKYGQPLSDLASDGSYLQKYDEMFQNTYAQQVGMPNGLYLRNMDFSDPMVQGKMLRAWDQVLGSSFINASTSGFQGNWYIAFNQYAANQTNLTQVGSCYNPLYQRASGNLAGVLNTSRSTQQISGCVPKEQFYPLLGKFLNQSAWYKDSVIVDGGSIVTARMETMQTASASNNKYSLDFMAAIRPLEDSINGNVFAAESNAAGNYVAFTWQSSYIFYEGDALLPTMALEYFVLALVGVGVVMLIMLVNPWTALIMMCAIGLVDLFLFGELWILDIKFNQVSVINMIMATGLAVDFSVYFAQKFMTVEADGTMNGRMQLALADTGSAVFLGGITALCGTVPMAFSKSVIIRTFFKLIFGTIIFSLLIGLMLLPVVLSLVGPPPIRSALSERHGDGVGLRADDPATSISSGKGSESSAKGTAVSRVEMV